MSEIDEEIEIEDDREYSDHIHDMFGLTYASYLVLPRSILQSMPSDWQCRFRALMKEYDEATSIIDDGVDYQVTGKDGNRFVQDPYRDYQRGRRVVDLAPINR